MKKILLVAVNAKYIHSNPAVYSLAAYANENLKLKNTVIEIGEYTINQEKQAILSDLYEKQADVVCFSCYIWNILQVMDLVVDLKLVKPDVKIWLGGPEVSFDGTARLKAYPQLTGIFIGEGEESFTQMVRREDEAKQGQADDLGWANAAVVLRLPSGEIMEHSPKEKTGYMSMDLVPFLYTEEGMKHFQNRIIYYESSRGCPFRCSYCLSSIEKQVRNRRLDIVLSELEKFLQMKVKQVKFVDRTFNCDAKRSMTIWSFLQEHDNGITNFHFEIAADLITEEQIALIKTMRPGLIQLEIGVQTTNEHTLSEIRRPVSFEKIAQVTKAIATGNNVHQHLDLIAGLPYEDMNSFEHSFNQVYALKPDQLQLGFLKVLKGSYMYEKAQDYELVYSPKPPFEVLSTRWLSYKDVITLKQLEDMLEVYYNSGLFRCTLTYLERHYESNFRMFHAMADYYHKNGLDCVSHSRMTRIEILYGFACQADPDHSPFYGQLLVHDLYSHELAKSRPTFARAYGSDMKEMIHSFYRGQEEAGEDRIYLKNPAYTGVPARTLANMTHLEQYDYSIDDIMSGRAVIDSTHQAREKQYIYLYEYADRNPHTGLGRCTLISTD